jgi:hypothetical protein
MDVWNKGSKSVKDQPERRFPSVRTIGGHILGNEVDLFDTSVL